ncbi:MAG: mannosyltransferase [Nitrospinaceae bacterium]|nr:MAG: mannosyltransferase [Nitrospinaceae bacterium]
MNLNKGIVVHDSFVFKGGGERLVHTLCLGLNLDLAFGAQSGQGYDLGKLPGKCIDLDVQSKLWGWRSVKRYYGFRQKTGFLKNYQTVIYSGQDAPLAVNNHPQGKNIFYCHTPPRSLYDLKEYRLSSLSTPQRLNHKAFNLFFQPLYESAIHKMDVIVANSANIQKRIKNFLRKDAIIIHPPCDTQQFHWSGQKDYYLSFARLDPLKRVDILVQAFTQMPDKRLIIASTGPELENLKKLADGKKNITFAGAVDDDQLKDLVGNAIATLYIPRDEDFGISPVESMAAGKPVLGVAEGGLLETIIPGETGILVRADPSPEDIIDAVQNLTPKRALLMRRVCEQQAANFSKDIFLEKMSALIDER